MKSTAAALQCLFFAGQRALWLNATRRCWAKCLMLITCLSLGCGNPRNAAAPSTAKSAILPETSGQKREGELDDNSSGKKEPQRTDAGSAGSEKNERINALRKEIAEELLGASQSSYKVAEDYKELFRHLRLEGLQALTIDEDISIALQAAWETHMKAVKRNPPIDYRADWVFDKKSVEGFLAMFAKRVKAEPPDWWSATLLKGDVFPESHHAFIDSEGVPPAAPKVTFEKDEVIMAAGMLSVRFSKTAYDQTASFPDIGGRPVALLGKEQCFFARPSFQGTPFTVCSLEPATGKKLWTAAVWAARRGGSTGPLGRHPVEIRRQGDTIIVYGGESHGMYAEGFEAKTGKCQFRFCTCYWFNFSEAWGLN